MLSSEWYQLACFTFPSQSFQACHKMHHELVYRITILAMDCLYKPSETAFYLSQNFPLGPDNAVFLLTISCPPPGHSCKNRKNEFQGWVKPLQYYLGFASSGLHFCNRYIQQLICQFLS